MAKCNYETWGSEGHEYCSLVASSFLSLMGNPAHEVVFIDMDHQFSGF